jgi:hypothetical protein
MNPPFDPYHRWLGIPKDEQPPHYYRLLGIRLFEKNLDVIDHAADRVSLHLRSLSLGPNGTDAQRLLNEVAAARVCLLDEMQRQRYEQLLARSLSTSAATPPAAPVAPPVAVVPQARPSPPPTQQTPQPLPSRPIPAASSRTMPAPPNGILSRPSPSGRGWYEIAKVVGGGILGLFIAQTILFYIANVDALGVMRLLHPRRKETAAETRKASVPEQSSKAVSRPSPSPSPRLEPEMPRLNPPPPSPPAAPPTTESRPKAPDPAPVEIPEPPKPNLAQIMEQLPASVDLPFVLDSGKSKLIDLRVNERPELSLHDSHCSIPDEAAFVLETVQARPEWSIQYCPKLNASPPQVEEIARLHLEPNEGLSFSWRSSGVEAAVRQQLRNCSLIIEHNGKHKQVALRTPLKVPALTIDLSKPIVVTTIDLPDFPDDKTIAINFADLGKFSRGATWKNSVSSITQGKRAFIEFGQFEGARLEFSLAKKSKGTLVIAMKPIFMEQSQPVEMTVTQLSKMENAIPQTIAENEGTLRELSAQQSSLSSELSSVQSRTPASLAEVNAQNVAVSALLSRTKRVSSRMTQLNQRNSVLKAKLQSIPQVKAFLGEIHQKAALNFSIVSVTEKSSILLVAGGAKTD